MLCGKNKMMYYRQCKLRQESWRGNETLLTTWIPEQFAHVGKKLRLQDKNGVWSAGWQVLEVGARQTEEYVVDNERDYLKQREASDI
jgi:hypothetical protein